MLCLFYENGMLKVLKDGFPNNLVIRVIPEKHMLYLDNEKRQLTFEKDYQVLNEMYKAMKELRGVNKCANDAYVSSIVKEYETIYKERTVYEWIKQARNALKSNK